jgi:hypothetical protein
MFQYVSHRGVGTRGRRTGAVALTLRALTQRCNYTLPKHQILLLSLPGLPGQSVDHLWLLHNLLALELLSREIHLDTGESIPVMESLT